MFDNILFNKTPSTETIPDMHNPLSNLEKRKKQKNGTRFYDNK